MNRNQIILDNLQYANSFDTLQNPDVHPATFLELPSIHHIETGPYLYRFVLADPDVSYVDIKNITEIDESNDKYIVIHYLNVEADKAESKILWTEGREAISKIYAVMRWNKLHGEPLLQLQQDKDFRQLILDRYDNAVPVKRVRQLKTQNMIQSFISIISNTMNLRDCVDVGDEFDKYILEHPIPEKWLNESPPPNSQNIPGVPNTPTTQYSKPTTQGLTDIPPIPGDPITYTATQDWWGTQTEGNTNE